MAKSNQLTNESDKHFTPWFDKRGVKIGVLVIIALAIAIAWPFIYNNVLAGSPGNPSLSVDGFFQYGGSLIAFAGTIALAAVALSQNKQANETSRELIEINKKYAAASDKLVEISEKMRVMQMDEHKAKFEVPNKMIDLPITEKENGNYQLSLNYELEVVHGQAFNIIIMHCEIYSSSNHWHDEYMNNRNARIQYKDSQTFEIPNKQFIQYSIGETICPSIILPKKYIDNKKSFMLHVSIDHEDIHQRSHTESLKLIYSIYEPRKFQYMGSLIRTINDTSDDAE